MVSRLLHRALVLGLSLLLIVQAKEASAGHGPAVVITVQTTAGDKQTAVWSGKPLTFPEKLTVKVVAEFAKPPVMVTFAASGSGQAVCSVAGQPSTAVQVDNGVASVTVTAAGGAGTCTVTSDVNGVKGTPFTLTVASPPVAVQPTVTFRGDVVWYVKNLGPTANAHVCPPIYLSWNGGTKVATMATGGINTPCEFVVPLPMSTPINVSLGDATVNMFKTGGTPYLLHFRMKPGQATLTLDSRGLPSTGSQTYYMIDDDCVKSFSGCYTIS
jgi:hypothetical protein